MLQICIRVTDSHLCYTETALFPSQSELGIHVYYKDRKQSSYLHKYEFIPEVNVAANYLKPNLKYATQTFHYP